MNDKQEDPLTVTVHLRDGLEYTKPQVEKILARVASNDPLKFTTPDSTFRWYKKMTNPLIDSQIRIGRGAKTLYSYQVAAMVLVVHCIRNNIYDQLKQQAFYGDGGFPYADAKALAESYGVVFADTVRIQYA